MSFNLSLCNDSSCSNNNAHAFLKAIPPRNDATPALLRAPHRRQYNADPFHHGDVNTDHLLWEAFKDVLALTPGTCIISP